MEQDSKRTRRVRSVARTAGVDAALATKVKAQEDELLSLVNTLRCRDARVEQQNGEIATLIQKLRSARDGNPGYKALEKTITATGLFSSMPTFVFGFTVSGEPQRAEGVYLRSPTLRIVCEGKTIATLPIDMGQQAVVEGVEIQVNLNLEMG